MRQIVFWGAGKVGKSMLDFWQHYGAQPNFFADNSVECQGTEYYGIKVISMEELKALEECFIVITSRQHEGIKNQLLKENIKEENIFYFSTPKEILLFFIFHMQGLLHWNTVRKSEIVKKDGNTSVLFELQNGFTLGGVEAWSVQMAEQLKVKGKCIRFVTTDKSGYKGNDADNELILFEWQNDPFDLEGLENRLLEYKKNLPSSIVCNFPCYTFITACIAKTIWPQEVNLIAVVHNDEEIYYDKYGEMKTVIDYCLVTCEMMRDRFIKGGMDKNKIRRLAWNISCESVLERTYSKIQTPIRIGYAGRIVIHQKRLDLLLEIVKKLRMMDVDFLLQIAGSGEYEEELKQNLNEYSKYVHFCGCISRDKVYDFWTRQDIGLNCSDFEGRCISKAESMAAGAVPVITDTSSARDDVKDGFNGYVVPVGDVDAIVDRIFYLYSHRELLELMGKRSHQVILKQNKENDLDKMWDEILR